MSAGMTMVLEDEANGPRRRRPSLHEEIVGAVRGMILDGELPPGSWIAEMKLCSDLGVSRTPLREALKVLASEALVVLVPNRGTRVAGITLADVAAQFEFMEAIQFLTAARAAERATQAEIDALQDMHREMIRLHLQGDRRGYFHLNQRIHTGIVQAARNPVLFAAHEDCAGKIRRARYQANLSYARWSESADEHEAFMSALVDRDGKRMGVLLGAHIRRTGEAVCAVLEKAEKRPPFMRAAG